MKQIIVTGIAAIAASFISIGVSPSHAASLDEIKKRGYITVVTEDDFRPFEFVKDGKPTGFDNELVEKLRSVAPFEVRQEIIPFTGLIPGVVSGKYDAAITGLLITKERQAALDFTLPIAEATIYYAKRKGDDKIKSIADLNGKPIGVQAGSAMYQRLPELQALLDKTNGKIGEITQYTSNTEAYQDLAIGRTDYVVNNIIGLNTLISEKPDVFEIGQPVSSKTYVGWGVAKGNDDVRAFLDDFITTEQNDGDFAALQKKWFGREFPNLPKNWVAEH
jgi:polar amino acid transport system substrate-binding protein